MKELFIICMALQELRAISIGIVQKCFRLSSVHVCTVCLCHNEKGKLLPVQIFDDVSYFMYELLIFMQSTLEKKSMLMKYLWLMLTHLN